MKDVLRNFAKFTGKQLCWILLLIQTPAQVFSYDVEHLFCRTSFFSVPYFTSIVIVCNSYTVQKNILTKIDGVVYSYMVVTRKRKIVCKDGPS